MNGRYLLFWGVLWICLIKENFILCRVPPSLSQAPFLDVQGSIITTQTICLQGAQYPYNGSLKWDESRKLYILLFREDLPGKTSLTPRGARLGVALLNKKFQQVGDCYWPPFQQFGHFVEDPRLFYINSQLYTLYYVYPINKCVTPCLVRIDKKTFKPQDTFLTTDGTLPQKNWIPLIHEKENQETIPVITRLFPFTFTTFIQKEDGNYKPLSGNSLTTIPVKQPDHWVWGKISGGTHGVRLDKKGGYYLTFFHSWFLTHAKKRFYVMGACLLDKDYPHLPKRISRYPIITSDMYKNKVHGLRGPVFSRRWARGLDRVIFPCGLHVVSTKDGREVAVVTCGENDNSIRVITFDLNNLINTLVSID